MLERRLQSLGSNASAERAGVRNIPSLRSLSLGMLY